MYKNFQPPHKHEGFDSIKFFMNFDEDNGTDYYLDKYYEKSPVDNPVNTTQTAWRVIRGGSWHYNAEYATVTSRDGPEPTFTNYNYGMRLARNAK